LIISKKDTIFCSLLVIAYHLPFFTKNAHFSNTEKKANQIQIFSFFEAMKNSKKTRKICNFATN